METPFHSPCAFNEKGVSKETCMSMTRVVQRNAQGCCAINCTSPVRLCKVCVLKSAKPQKVSNAITGLCELHTAGYVEEKTRTYIPKRTEERFSVPKSVYKKEEGYITPTPVTASLVEKPNVEQSKVETPKAETQTKAKPSVLAKKQPTRTQREMPDTFKKLIPQLQMNYMITALKGDVSHLRKLAYDVLIAQRELHKDTRTLTPEMRSIVVEQIGLLRRSLENLLQELKW